MNRRDSASLFLAVFPYCSFVSFVCFHQSRFEHGQLDEAEERADTFNIRNGRSRRRSRIENDKPRLREQKSYRTELLKAKVFGLEVQLLQMNQQQEAQLLQMNQQQMNSYVKSIIVLAVGWCVQL